MSSGFPVVNSNQLWKECKSMLFSDSSMHSDSHLDASKYLLNELLQVPREKGAAQGGLGSLYRKQIISNPNVNRFSPNFVEV